MLVPPDLDCVSLVSAEHEGLLSCKSTEIRGSLDVQENICRARCLWPLEKIQLPGDHNIATVGYCFASLGQVVDQTNSYLARPGLELTQMACANSPACSVTDEV